MSSVSSRIPVSRPARSAPAAVLSAVALRQYADTGFVAIPQLCSAGDLSEIRATLAAARACRYRRIHVLFQPHRYTRTQALMDDFARAFHQADTVHVIDIYAASESPMEGVSSQALTERLQTFGHRGAVYAGSMDAGIDSVLQAAESGDAIVTLGAGSVSQAGDKIVERLRSGR